MKISGYNEMMRGLECGEPESAKNAIKALCAVLKNAVNSQYLLPYQNDEFKISMNLANHLLVSIDAGAISIVPGRHTQVEDDDFITRSSYEQHWENKGRQFFEDLAKNIREREAGDEVKGVEEGIQKAKKERAILERKAAAFDEIEMAMKGVYRALNVIDGSFDNDTERKDILYAAVCAVFDLGVISQIIEQTKLDVVNAE